MVLRMLTGKTRSGSRKYIEWLALYARSKSAWYLLPSGAHYCLACRRLQRKVSSLCSQPFVHPRERGHNTPHKEPVEQVPPQRETGKDLSQNGFSLSFFLSCLSFRGRSSGLCTCFSSQELFTSHACSNNRMFYGVVCAGTGSTCTEQPEHATKCSSEKANHQKTNKRWVKAQGLPFY